MPRRLTFIGLAQSTRICALQSIRCPGAGRPRRSQPEAQSAGQRAVRRAFAGPPSVSLPA